MSVCMGANELTSRQRQPHLTLAADWLAFAVGAIGALTINNNGKWF